MWRREWEANCSFRRVNVTRPRDCLDVSRNNIEGWESWRDAGVMGCVNYEELVRAGNKSYAGWQQPGRDTVAHPLADLKCVRACHEYFRIRIQKCIGTRERERETWASFACQLIPMAFRYLAFGVTRCKHNFVDWNRFTLLKAEEFN